MTRGRRDTNCMGPRSIWDLENASIRFEAGTRGVVADITVVGTVAESHGTFQWA